MNDVTEYMSGNRMIRYPFADDFSFAGDVPDSSALLVFGCFVDAAVTFRKNATGPVRVRIAGLSGHTLAFDFVSPDGETTRLTCARSTTAYPVIRGENDWCWFVFVLSSDGIRRLEGNSGAIGIAVSEDIPLCNRCLCSFPSGVTSLLVYGGSRMDSTGARLSLQDALDAPPDEIVRGAVRIEEGYNARLTPDGNEITVDAVPGAGLGTAPCPCDIRAADENERGIWSPDGHVRLFNDTCYDLVPSTKYGRLLMHVKCKACCTCEMYESIVRDRLIPLKNLVLGDKASLRNAFDTYERNVLKWNARMRTAYPEDIVVTVAGVPLDAAATDIQGGDVSGTMNRCSFSVAVRNDSFVTVVIELRKIRSNGSIFQATVGNTVGGEPVTTTLTFPDEDDSGSDEEPAPTFQLGPGKSLSITYFVRLKGQVTTDSQHGFTTFVELAAYQGDRLVTVKSKSHTI